MEESKVPSSADDSSAGARKPSESQIRQVQHLCDPGQVGQPTLEERLKAFDSDKHGGEHLSFAPVGREIIQP